MTPEQRELLETDTLSALLRGIEKQAADMAHVQQTTEALEELGGSIVEADKRLQAAKENQE